MREQLENYIRILKEKLEESKKEVFGFYSDLEVGFIIGKEAEREQVILELEEIYRQEL